MKWRSIASYCRFIQLHFVFVCCGIWCTFSSLCFSCSCTNANWAQGQYKISWFPSIWGIRCIWIFRYKSQGNRIICWNQFYINCTCLFVTLLIIDATFYYSAAFPVTVRFNSQYRVSSISLAVYRKIRRCQILSEFFQFCVLAMGCSKERVYFYLQGKIPAIRMALRSHLILVLLYIILFCCMHLKSKFNIALNQKNSYKFSDNEHNSWCSLFAGLFI